MGGCVRGSVTLYLVNMIATTVFAQSLSNFTCTLFMMRGGILLILVTGSKVKVNFGTQCIKPCGHDTDYSFCLINFKLHMHIVHDEIRNPIDFGSRGQRFNINFGTLYKTLWARYRLQFLPNHFQTSHASCG